MPVKVLIVDDQQPFRDVAVLAVSMVEGFQVIAEAETGEASVELARKLHPDLVLMDVNLPGIDGLEATRQIRQEASQVVVLLVSTYSYDDFAPRAAECGASAYIPKSKFGPLALADAWGKASHELLGSGGLKADEDA